MSRTKKFEEQYKLRREILKSKRELRKEALGGTESAHQRFYTELTKTRRALKIEAGLSKSKGTETTIEAFVEDCLKEFDVSFVKQKVIRYINVDFFIAPALVIEVQGCYWHVCPKCYPAGPKNEIQRKNLDKNKRTEEFCEEAGYVLLPVWGHEIKKEPEKTKQTIKEYVENNRKTSTNLD